MERSDPHLRLLATTDVHMHVMPFDYRHNRATKTVGLAKLATLIRRARDEVPGAATLLLDNGDLLQGTELSETLAAGYAPEVIADLMSLLGYDAMGLGNHDFDYGLEYLQKFLDRAAMAVLCSNLAVPGTAPCHMVERRIEGQALKIGIFSVLPPQTMLWNARHLSALPAPLPQVDAARRMVQSLRADGADVVIALAHTGLAPEGMEETENAARAIAQVPGIDALVCGHAHRRLPGPDYEGRQDVDAQTGRIAGVPAVMAGYGASHLGVIDLWLTKEVGWKVTQAKSALRPVLTSTPFAKDIKGAIAAAHKMTRARLAEPLGQTDQPLHSYFAALGRDTSLPRVASAIARVAQEEIAGSALAALPLIVAAAPNAAGGRGGAANYVDIPPGRLLRRHAAALLPYPNAVWVLRLRGADVYAWAEQAAQYFGAWSPERIVPMTDPHIPSFNFDYLFGVHTIFDPMRPVGQRVVSLTRDGRALPPDANVLVATTSYRAAGGGQFPGAHSGNVVAQTETLTRTALMEDFGVKSVGPSTPTWTFAPRLGCIVELTTGPGALAHLGDIADLSPHVADLDADGFQRLHLTL